MMSRALVMTVLVCSFLTRGAGAQTTTPPSAQSAAQFPAEPAPDDTRGKIGYAEGNFGLASTVDGRAPLADVEGGVRLSPHVSAFGTYGRYQNLQPSAGQPYVDIAAAQLAKRNIRVTGEARDPAQYAVGGLRFELPMPLRITPYALAGMGFARSSPTARFTYVAGSPTIGGGTASSGQNASDDVLSTGVFVGDGWNAIMFRVGGGIIVPIGASLFVDAGYTTSRIQAPTPIAVHGLRLGLAVRF